MSSRALVVTLALLALAPGCSWSRAAVYDPDPDVERPAPPLALPGETPVEEVWLTSSDGTRLHARLARKPGATRAVLFCHGTGGNVVKYTQLARDLRDRTRAHVLVFDYRGYGRSEGEPDEPGIEADARAALEALDAAVGVTRARTIVVGHSLGGAVAIDLAGEAPGLGGLAVLSTFTSLEDEARHLTGLGALANFVPDKWESIEKVRSVACPELFVAGLEDSCVPSEHAERLYDAATGRKRLVLVSDGEHEMWSHELVWRELASFVESVAPEPVGASQ